MLSKGGWQCLPGKYLMRQPFWGFRHAEAEALVQSEGCALCCCSNIQQLQIQLTGRLGTLRGCAEPCSNAPGWPVLMREPGPRCSAQSPVPSAPLQLQLLPIHLPPPPAVLRGTPGDVRTRAAPYHSPQSSRGHSSPTLAEAMAISGISCRPDLSAAI